MDRLRNLLSAQGLVGQLQALHKAQTGQQLNQHELQAVGQLYEHAVATMSPDERIQANEKALAALSPDQRQQLVAQFQEANDDPKQAFSAPELGQGGDPASPRQMAALAVQAQQQQPDIFSSLIQAALKNPAVQAAIVGIITTMLQQMLGGALGGGGQQTQPRQPTFPMPQQQPQQPTFPAPQQQQPTFPMPQQPTQQQPTQQQQGGGGLGDILGQILGGGSGGGSGGGGNASILGPLLQQILAGGSQRR